MTCSDCKFWKPVIQDPNETQTTPTGKCKWGPPQRVGPNVIAWPTTPGNEFCFRWETATTQAEAPEFPRPATPEELAQIERGRGNLPPVPEEPEQDRLNRLQAERQRARDKAPASSPVVDRTVNEVPPVPSDPAPVTPPGDRLFDSQVHKAVKQAEKKVTKPAEKSE